MNSFVLLSGIWFHFCFLLFDRFSELSYLFAFFLRKSSVHAKCEGHVIFFKS